MHELIAAFSLIILKNLKIPNNTSTVAKKLLMWQFLEVYFQPKVVFSRRSLTFKFTI